MNLFLGGQSLTKTHLETIFDVVKVVKVLQVSVTPLLQKVLLRLTGGLGMHIVQVANIKRMISPLLYWACSDWWPENEHCGEYLEYDLTSVVLGLQ